MGRGGARQPGRTCANGVADSRDSFPEFVSPSPSARVAGLGVVRPKTNGPHGIKMIGFSETFGASASQATFNGRSLRQVGISASKDDVFPDAVPNNRNRHYARCLLYTSPSPRD